MARNISILKKEARPPAGRAGFTLVELLVVIAIMVLLTGIIVPNWRASQNSLALQRSSIKVSQDVKKAEELALKGQWFSCATGRISGYGIYFNVSSPTSYIIFADCNSNKQYDVLIDGVVETLILESGIVIASVAQNPASIAFIPPDPAVWINGNQASGAQVTITLVVQTNPSNAKVVAINSKGVVSIQ